MLFWKWLWDGLHTIDWKFWKFIGLVLVSAFVTAGFGVFAIKLNNLWLFLGVPFGSLIMLYAFYWYDNN